MTKAKTIAHNADAVEKYIVNRERLHKAGMGAAYATASKEKGSSSPAVPDKAFDYLDHPDNRHAARYIEPVLKDMSNHNHTYQGVDLWNLVLVAGYGDSDPGALRRWKAGGTKADRARAEAWKCAMLLIAHAIYSRYGDVRVRVVIPRAEEQADSRRDAASQKRRWTREDSLKRLQPLIQAKVEQGYTVTAAVYEVAGEQDVSPRKLWDAWTYGREESA